MRKTKLFSMLLLLALGCGGSKLKIAKNDDEQERNPVNQPTGSGGSTPVVNEEVEKIARVILEGNIITTGRSYMTRTDSFYAKKLADLTGLKYEDILSKMSDLVLYSNSYRESFKEKRKIDFLGETRYVFFTKIKLPAAHFYAASDNGNKNSELIDQIKQSKKLVREHAFYQSLLGAIHGGHVSNKEGNKLHSSQHDEIILGDIYTGPRYKFSEFVRDPKNIENLDIEENIQQLYPEFKKLVEQDKILTNELSTRITKSYPEFDKKIAEYILYHIHTVDANTTDIEVLIKEMEGYEGKRDRALKEFEKFLSTAKKA